MSFLIRSLAVRYGSDYRIPPHHHEWGQLIYAASGVMRVSAEGAMWIVPPARAIWVPAEARHEIVARSEVAMRTLYLAPRTRDRPTGIVPRD